MPTSPYRRHALLSSFASVMLYASGLITGPIIARVLGPDGRGDLAALIAPTTVLSWMLALGIPTAAAYFVGKVREETLLITATVFGLVVGTPVCAALWVLAPKYFAGHSPEVLGWGRVVLVAMPAFVGMFAALEVRRRQKPGLSWNCWRAAPIILPTAGTVVLALAGRLTLDSALAINVVGAMLPLLLLASMIARGRGWPRPSFAALRLMLPYAWRTALLSTATSVTSRLDQVILVALVAPAQLGFYVVAVTVASVTNPLTSGFSAALFGHLRSEQSEERAVARFRRSLQAAVLLSSSVALVLAVAAPLLLRLVFGGQFQEATTPLRLLLPGSIALDVVGVITSKLLSEGRPGMASSAALLGAAITVGGLAALTPRYGINGAAVVTSLAWISQVMFLVARGALRFSPGASDSMTTAAGSPPATATDLR